MNDVIEGLEAILGDERARQMASDIGITSVGRTRKLISIPNVIPITNEETVNSANLLNAGLTHSGPSSGRTISCKPSYQLWPVDRSTIDYSIIEITHTMAYQNASPVVNASGKTRLQESLERARDRLGPSLGQWLALPGHALAKTIAPLGEDWVLIDCEHGHIDDYNMYLQISAISSSGVSPVVRIPAGEPWMVKRALDAGAHAIMVPMCETKEQAMQIVESAKYPSKSYPNGFRGTGAMFAPAAFNLTGREYLLNANSNVMIFVQIESRKGVENVEEIAKVDGIDMLFIGPNDLASSLGYVAFDHATTPEVQQATQRILDATLAAGKYAGHFALDAATAAQRYEQGFHFVNCGADIVALTSQMSAEIRKVKDLTTKNLAYNAANGSGSENGVKRLDGRGNGSVDAVKLY
ncbi:Pyruvate/Phosphoenolpyruvate kinase-like domain-containing protein [Fusarium oxysporum]|nr:Pyruvate/Phosphoenolpyruvate kinase-like domain-containing protein [Fusarium oxysporum]